MKSNLILTAMAAGLISGPAFADDKAHDGVSDVGTAADRPTTDVLEQGREAGSIGDADAARLTPGDDTRATDPQAADLDQTDPNLTNLPDQPLEGEAVNNPDQERVMIPAAEIAGADLWDFHGNQIGSIEKLLVSSTGSGLYAVVNAGEVLEEDRKIAVPWRSITVKENPDDEGAFVYSLDADKQRLMNAPEFQEEASNDLTDDNEAQQVHQFWNVRFMPTQPKADTPGQQVR